MFNLSGRNVPKRGSGKVKLSAFFSQGVRLGMVFEGVQIEWCLEMSQLSKPTSALNSKKLELILK